MSPRVDANLKKELKHFGSGQWNDCFHCGNCTAICPLSEDDSMFPRKGIRTLQMGLKEKLASSPEPWMCYYCGECSDTCPRDANPGELMMALRRYLTAVYDWTGLSGKLYKSKLLHAVVMVFLFLAVLAAFAVFAQIPQLTDPKNVQLNTFAPPNLISLVDEILLGVLSFFLLTNVFNMYWKIVIKDKSVKIPLWLYVKEAVTAAWHFFTQWRFSKCDRKFYWLAHLFLMTSYIIMFGMIVFFLDWFQTDQIHPATHPQRWLGYYVTFGLIFATVYAFIGRLRKKEAIFKFSHHSDWIFIFLLFMIAVTGILIHIFRISGMAMPTYYMYALHLAFEVPMVVTFVAFSKWSHLAYRPFAIYFTNLKKSAKARLAQA
jgi:ferredoxin